MNEHRSDPMTAKEEEKAKQVAFDFLELTEKIDYNKYFESMGAVSGQKAAEYSKFSKKAAIAAAAKLDEFFALMDRDQLEAARSQVMAFADPAPEAEVLTDDSRASTGEVATGFSDGYETEQ